MERKEITGSHIIPEPSPIVDMLSAICFSDSLWDSLIEEGKLTMQIGNESFELSNVQEVKYDKQR